MKRNITISLDEKVARWARVKAAENDTNVLASDIMRRLWKERTGVISTQVCNEFYVTVTRKLDPGLTPDEAWDDLDALLAWNPIPVDAA